MLTAAGLAVRLAIPRGIDVDEATSIHEAGLRLGTLIQTLAHADQRPPLHPLLLWAVRHIFGSGDLVLRAPSIAAGTMLVPIGYLLGAEVFDRRTGLMTGLLAALAPILVWYGQEAREYALEALFCGLVVLGCVRAIQRGRRRDWALHALAAVLAVWSHWFAICVVLATEVVLLAELARRRRMGESVRAWAIAWGVSSAVLAVELVPLAVLAIDQARYSGAYAGVVPGGHGLSFYTTVTNVSYALFGLHPDAVSRVLSAVWPLAMLASLVALGRGVNRRAAVLLACSAGPVLVLFGVGWIAPDAFDARYFVAFLTPALVLVARLATAWPRTGGARLAVAAALAVLSAGALADQQLDHRNPRRYDFRGALAKMDGQLGPRDVLLYEPPDLRYVLEHYRTRVTARPLRDPLPRPDRPGRVVVLVASSMGSQHIVDQRLGALRATRPAGAVERRPGVTTWMFR